MKCPRCVQRVTPGEASCYHCGYSMAVACGFYGEGSVVAQSLMDVESRLTEQERASIQQIFANFTTQFPQLFFLMYLGALPPPASPRQFAFWLLNHAALQDVEAHLPNERGLLLLVDPSAGAAVLATGYFLEHFVTQAELDAVMRSTQKELGRADYAGALRAIISQITSLLKTKEKEFARNPVSLSRGQETTPVFPPLQRTGEPVLEGAPATAASLTISREDELQVIGSAPSATARPVPATKTVRRLKSAARRQPPRRS